MAKFQPVAAQAKLAAELLDIKQAEFLDAVDKGILPPGREIAGVVLWDVEQLRQIISGNAAEGMEGVRW